MHIEKLSDLPQKQKDFEEALSQFVGRLSEDRNILAAILVGSISELTIWRKERVRLWVIEVDGVSKRLKSDGNDERIWRTLVEDGININAELIPRSRFKMMVEGSSRTAFSCNFFAERRLVYCNDPSIKKWFETANSVAVKDHAIDLMVAMTWLIEITRHSSKQLQLKDDLQLTRQYILWSAMNLASVEVVRHGEVYEDQAIYRGIELQPELFDQVYVQVLTKKPTKKQLTKVIDIIVDYIEEHWEKDMRPLLQYLKKQKRTVPLSELCDHFAHSQLYPSSIEAACEWMAEAGHIEKLSMPFKLTKKSRVDFEEPAYSI